ncbi:MAG: hypothetical protein PHO10_03635 [Gemmiger sp.]|nr:hypothetical protein [Gemmiger sp.]
MNLKKIITVVAAVAMACVFATSAFAKTNDEKAVELRAYAASNGIDISGVSFTPEQLDNITANKASLKAQADSLIASAKADPANAQSYANQAAALAASVGVTVANPTVTVTANNTITVVASVNGASSSGSLQTTTNITKEETSAHPEIAEAIKNGTWGKTEGAAAANPLTASGSAVIKATGDNAGAFLVAAVLAVAAMLGLAVRKSNAMVA